MGWRERERRRAELHNMRCHARISDENKSWRNNNNNKRSVTGIPETAVVAVATSVPFGPSVVATLRGRVCSFPLPSAFRVALPVRGETGLASFANAADEEHLTMICAGLRSSFLLSHCLLRHRQGLRTLPLPVAVSYNHLSVFFFFLSKY